MKENLLHIRSVDLCLMFPEEFLLFMIIFSHAQYNSRS